MTFGDLLVPFRKIFDIYVGPMRAPYTVGHCPPCVSISNGTEIKYVAVISVDA